jgi:glutamate racemase
VPVLYSYTAMIPSILPSTGPIGVFDSGYGGLTILDKIRGLMPEYDYIYLGDSARCPYGPRSFEVVYEFTLQAVSKLFELGCPLVILACNTASAKALRTIQQINLPVIDATRRVLGVIRPTAECIGEITRSRHVGILATAGTIKSESYLLEIHKLSPDIVVTGEACPMWVSLVENNEYQSEGADYFVKQHINRLLDKDPMIDTIILGCTHYPLLLDKIRQFTPESIRIISQGEYVARSLRDYLNRHPEMDARCDKGGNCRFLTTESENKFEESASIFLGRQDIKVKSIALE